MAAKRKGKETERNGGSAKSGPSTKSRGPRSRRRKSCIFVDDAVVEVDDVEDLEDGADESHHDIQSGKNSLKEDQSDVPVVVKDEEWCGSELEGFEDSEDNDACNANIEVPGLLCIPTEINNGMWVRMKFGNYKGDLAQVVAVSAAKKRATVKLVPRIDLKGLTEKLFGDGSRIPVKNAAIPVPRFINSRELKIFGRHIKTKCDPETGELFEILDGLMLKDGYLFKKVSFFSLIYSGVRPSKVELSKFEPTEDKEPQDMEWIANIYQERNLETSNSNLERERTYQLYDLVLFGQKDFGVIISMESNSFQILMGDVEESVLANIQQKDIKKSCNSKMFTASDCHMKTMYVNDTVKVTEGLQKGRVGTIKHIYKGALFIYDEHNPENNGYFTANSESCEILKDTFIGNMSCSRGILGRKEDAEQHSQRENSSGRFERFERSREELPFRVGQTLRIRVGALKGYICRVVRVHRSGALLVRLDSSGKFMKVDADCLIETSTNLYSKDADVSKYDRFDYQGGLPEGELGFEVEGIPCQASGGSHLQSSAWNPVTGWQAGSSSSAKDQDENGAGNDPWASNLPKDKLTRELTSPVNGSPVHGGSWTQVEKSTGHTNDSWSVRSMGEEHQSNGANESQPVDSGDDWSQMKDHGSGVDLLKVNQTADWGGERNREKVNASQNADRGGDRNQGQASESQTAVWGGDWNHEKVSESQTADLGVDWNQGKVSKSQTVDWEGDWSQGMVKKSQFADRGGDWNQGMVNEGQTSDWGGDWNHEKVNKSQTADRRVDWNHGEEKKSQLDGWGGDRNQGAVRKSQYADRRDEWNQGNVNGSQTADWGGDWNQGKVNKSQTADQRADWNHGEVKKSQLDDWGGDRNQGTVKKSHYADRRDEWNQGNVNGSQTADWGGGCNPRKVNKSQPADWGGDCSQVNDSQAPNWGGGCNQGKGNSRGGSGVDFSYDCWKKSVENKVATGSWRDAELSTGHESGSWAARSTDEGSQQSQWGERKLTSKSQPVDLGGDWSLTKVEKSTKQASLDWNSKTTEEISQPVDQGGHWNQGTGQKIPSWTTKYTEESQPRERGWEVSHMADGSWPETEKSRRQTSPSSCEIHNPVVDGGSWTEPEKSTGKRSQSCTVTITEDKSQRPESNEWTRAEKSTGYASQSQPADWEERRVKSGAVALPTDRQGETSGGW